MHHYVPHTQPISTRKKKMEDNEKECECCVFDFAKHYRLEISGGILKISHYPQLNPEKWNDVLEVKGKTHSEGGAARQKQINSNNIENEEEEVRG
jgi:hypothetical protein